MYLAKLTVKGFRKIDEAALSFRPGLNIIIGENNAGKTAVIDALRALLATTEEGSLRLDETDLHLNAEGKRAAEILFRYTFSGLNLDEEADFAAALKPSTPAGTYEAQFNIRYTATTNGRLRPKRWCGDHEDNGVSAEMLEDLRAIYLPPLRDPASGLRPSRSSQLARLLGRLATPNEKDNIVQLVREFEAELEKQTPVASTQKAIDRQQKDMLGDELKQQLSVGLTAPDFQRIAARLQLEVDSFDVESNGLGYNNLLYMAVVLSELETNPDAAYRALIIEEPEAHLHPQLQGVLLQFLQSKEAKEGVAATVQIFVSSHSPNFASIADVDTLCCVHRTPSGVKAFCPRSVEFKPTSKKDKLQRYLDVTRAELFFARRVILVEGAAELFIVDALARKAGYDLKRSSVSLLSTDGLNFDCFLPLFGDNALNIRVAVISDADPPADAYPSLTDTTVLSANAKLLDAGKSAWVQSFFAKKTLEYDFALHEENRAVMISALKDIHPTIGKALEEKVDAAVDSDKAKELFRGMFKRDEGTDVQKGRYAQALAAAINDEEGKVEIPLYIKDALDFVTKA
ncbi:putative ATP-dependent endonuclease of OLD family [Paraburkholderia sp. RAU6.4a]|uniref:ATP-dependent nuclease n=1 Tax=Paraburkholderia sp. RAU6.4a TaxID=2991067 RepID=UPI003D24923A